MPTIPAAELKKFLPKINLNRALQLTRDRRVYNLKAEDGRAAACVLADAPLPHLVRLRHDGPGLEWECDCGAGEACVHVWALAVRLYQEDRLYHPLLRARIGDALGGPRGGPRSGAPEGGGQGELFGEAAPAAPAEPGGRRRERGADKAAEAPAAGVPAAADERVAAAPGADLFSESLLPERGGIPETSIKRGAPAAPAPRRPPVFIVRFDAANRPELVVEGAAALAAAGSGPVAALERRLALEKRLALAPDARLPLGAVLGELAALAEACPGEPVVCFATPRQGLPLRRIGRIGLRPQYQRSDAAGRARYSLALSVAAEGMAEPLPAPLAGLACEHGLVYVCPRQGDFLAYGDAPGLAAAAARLRQLPSSLGALDLERLRRWLAERPDCPVALDMPEGERFVYRDVDPRPVLTLQGGGPRTELFLSFDYDGADCAWHDDRDDISRPLGDGATLVMPRRREREAAALAALKEIAAESVSYESGLYANLIAHRAVADLSVVCGLSDFVARYGAAVLAAGIELRLEGRRIRGGGGLSFRVESDQDWFGFKAGWKPARRGASGDGAEPGAASAETEAPASYPLAVDDNLDRLGLAAGADEQGAPAWILLGKRDVDRLKLLRKLGMDADGRIETSPVNVTLIDSLYDQTENRGDAAVTRARELARRLDEFGRGGGGEGHPAPAGLRASLRAYQRVGFDWLRFLHGQKLGGCLADDMGLGKTVQTIALLQSLRESGELRPSLLVAPVVTLPNWEDELARFAPGLRVKRHGGPGRARTVDRLLAADESAAPDAAAGETALPADVPAVDLLLVSYHTLRNDLDLFVQREWYYLILDEAHYIKNAGSQIFKAIRVLEGEHRLSLTGTPIENSTMELWSQFSFLNPGLLGGRKAFSSELASPIEREGSDEALGTLRDTISPFILRRRKEDVLTDLPPKSEILHWCEMAPDQARLYDEQRALFRDQIAGLLDGQGVERSSMDIFRCLLRLRQIAINPAMVRAPGDAGGEGPYAGVSSAKMDSLRLIVDKCLDEDHKLLVFSQFVASLKLIGAGLDADGVRHALLTGATVDRRAQVQAFQDDPELRIFLLSLKAGGVGINLTRADYVVLFDPWWNPAAERQAVDRAHRIGQRRPVIVYKMITRGTIEEKIFALQAKKHRLAGNLIDGEETGLFHGMREDEIMELFGT